MYPSQRGRKGILAQDIGNIFESSPLAHCSTFDNVASSSKDEADDKQDHANRNGSISKIKDGEIQANLRNAEPDEIDDRTVDQSIEQIIADCSANDQTKGQFGQKRTCLEYAQVEIHDHRHSDGNEHEENGAIAAEDAESSPSIAGIIQGEIGTDQRYLRAEVGWA